MANRDVTNLVERLEAFEERLGVRIEGLFATTDEGNTLTVNGELHLFDGTTLKRNIYLVIAAYDADGRVLGTRSDYFASEKFFGFETFSFFLNLPSTQVATIRIYPKAT